MAAFNFSPIGNTEQFFGAVGANYPPNLPLNGGFLNTFQAGTSTPIATYTSNLGTIQNSPTMQLQPDGRFAGEIWLAAGQGYKFQLTDSTGYQIWVVDNILGINDSASSITSEWIASGFTPTFSNATTFTTAGNTTSTFQVGRRIKAVVTAGTVYGNISSSTFGVSTTVVLIMDSGMALDSGLNAVSVGLLGESNPSVPAVLKYPVTIGGTQTNDNAATGQIGEYLTNNSAPAGLSLGVGTPTTSLSLTAGDWEAWGVGIFSWGGTAPTGCLFEAGVSNISGGIPLDGPYWGGFSMTLINFTITLPVVPRRFSLATTTTVYLNIFANNLNATPINGSGNIYARRMR